MNELFPVEEPTEYGAACSQKEWIDVYHREAFPNEEHERMQTRVSELEGSSDPKDQIELASLRYDLKTHEPRATNPFWHQKLAVAMSLLNRKETGRLFYHGMGTGKTFLYAEYMMRTWEARPSTRFYVVVKRVLHKPTRTKLFKLFQSNKISIESIKREKRLLFLTYKELAGIYNDGVRDVKLKDASVVLIDEAHNILERNALKDGVGASDVLFRKTLQLSRSSFARGIPFMLYSGTPMNNHEVDLVNLLRVANPEFDDYLGSLKKGFQAEYAALSVISHKTFQQVSQTWNTEEWQVFFQTVGSSLSFVQLTEDVVRAYQSSDVSDFALETDTHILHSKDISRFVTLCVAKMGEAHTCDFIESHHSTHNTMRSDLRTFVQTIYPEIASSSVQNPPPDKYRYRLDDLEHAPQEETNLYFEREFVLNIKENMKLLMDQNGTQSRFRVLSEFCPVMGKIVKLLVNQYEQPTRGVSILYSYYSHMMTNDQRTNKKDGKCQVSTCKCRSQVQCICNGHRHQEAKPMQNMIPRILNAFKFVEYKSDNVQTKDDYMRFIYLHENSAHTLINEVINHPDNWDGRMVRVVLISPKFGEGISIANVQDIHVLCPDFGQFSKTDQAIARGVRSNMHNELKRHWSNQCECEDKVRNKNTGELQCQEYKPDFDPSRPFEVKVYLHVTVPHWDYAIECAKEEAALAKIREMDPALHLPYHLGYYIKLFSRDVSLRLFERMCKVHASDCCFLKDRNRPSTSATDGVRECQYVGCEYECVLQTPAGTVSVDSYHPSFYGKSRLLMQALQDRLRHALAQHMLVSVAEWMEAAVSRVPDSGVMRAVFTDAVLGLVSTASPFPNRHGVMCVPILIENLNVLAAVPVYANGYHTMDALSWLCDRVALQDVDTRPYYGCLQKERVLTANVNIEFGELVQGRELFQNIQVYFDLLSMVQKQALSVPGKVFRYVTHVQDLPDSRHPRITRRVEIKADKPVKLSTLMTKEAGSTDATRVVLFFARSLIMTQLTGYSLPPPSTAPDPEVKQKLLDELRAQVGQYTTALSSTQCMLFAQEPPAYKTYNVFYKLAHTILMFAEKFVPDSEEENMEQAYMRQVMYVLSHFLHMGVQSCQPRGAKGQLNKSTVGALFVDPSGLAKKGKKEALLTTLSTPFKVVFHAFMYKHLSDHIGPETTPDRWLYATIQTGGEDALRALEKWLTQFVQDWNMHFVEQHVEHMERVDVSYLTRALENVRKASTLPMTNRQVAEEINKRVRGMEFTMDQFMRDTFCNTLLLYAVIPATSALKLGTEVSKDAQSARADAQKQNVLFEPPLAYNLFPTTSTRGGKEDRVQTGGHEPGQMIQQILQRRRSAYVDSETEEWD